MFWSGLTHTRAGRVLSYDLAKARPSGLFSGLKNCLNGPANL